MPYISGKRLIEHAWKNKYAIGAFSIHNAEGIQAVLKAAEEERAPVMMQIGQKVIQNMGLYEMRKMVDCFIRDVSVPVCIHLDHSHSYEQTLEAIQLRFQSVMFDGSALAFEDNADTTRKIVEFANALNIGAEGEIGKIRGTEDDISVRDKDAMLTTCDEAFRFVEKTGVNYLAVSIGTAHGVYKKTPKLAFQRLKDISNVVKRPIVLHGGSGVPDDQVRKSISLGVAKINVDTELRQAFAKGVYETLKNNPEEYQLGVLLGNGREAMKEKVKEKIKLFGSDNRADEF
ncbi:class II fructose-bisphosphate aldolase [Clostridium sp. LBM24168]